ncbi:MAG: hypothetical protein ACJ8R9_10850 [Steroidobacteraceae bacterium]
MIKLDEIDVMDASECVSGHIEAALIIVHDELGVSEHPDARVTRFTLAIEVAKLLQVEEHFWLSHGKEIE